MERQIRIREDLEDYLKVARDADEEGAESIDKGGGGDDELEGIVNERRRLAPY